MHSCVLSALVPTVVSTAGYWLPLRFKDNCSWCFTDILFYVRGKEHSKNLAHPVMSKESCTDDRHWLNGWGSCQAWQLRRNLECLHPTECLSPTTGSDSWLSFLVLQTLRQWWRSNNWVPGTYERDLERCPAPNFSLAQTQLLQEFEE